MNKCPDIGSTALGPLPTTVTTLRGATFDANMNCWNFHDGVETVSVNFALFPSQVARPLVNSIKRALIWYAENLSPGQLKSHMSNLLRLFRFLAAENNVEINELTVHDLMNYRAKLASHEEWYLGAVASCLRKWHELGIPGISEDAIRFLDQVRLRGTPKGKAILTMDPLHGPFTNIEVQAIRDALNDAYADRMISLNEYILAYLFMLLGQRSKQMALLKVADVRCIEKEGGTVEYVLRIPRVKQGSRDLLAEYKERLIAPVFGALLKHHADKVAQRFEGILDDPQKAPLFPTWHISTGQPVEFHYHQSSYAIGRLLRQVIDGLNVHSERTGTLLHITPTRFRRTTGTRAAQEGHGELVIAELLDHSDTQNVGVYVRATPEIIERIDEAISLQLAPIANAFRGRIISDEKDAIRGGDPSSRVVDPRFDSEFKPMGNCGRHGACDFLAPIACYTCKSFQAWVDGPHEEVLRYLKEERVRLRKSTDDRIATINDRTILAVQEVIDLCRRELSGKEGRAHE